MDMNCVAPDFIDYLSEFIEKQRKIRDKLYKKSKLRYSTISDYEEYIKQAFYVDGINDTPENEGNQARKGRAPAPSA